MMLMCRKPGSWQMEDAEESLGTVYFEDDLADARESIETLLAKYEKARVQLPTDESKALVQV